MNIDNFQSVNNSSTTGTTTLVMTLAFAVPIGQKLVLAAGRVDNAGSTIVGIQSIVDSKGNTWALNDATSTRANQGSITFAHSDVTTALATGDTITVTWSATTTKKFMDVWSVSGLAAGGAHATTGTAATANTNSGPNGASNAPTGSLTTTLASCLIFGATYAGPTAVPFTAGSGFTIDSNVATTSGTSDKGWGTERQTATSAGAKTVNFAASASSAWTLAGVAFANVTQPNAAMKIRLAGGWTPATLSVI